MTPEQKRALEEYQATIAAYQSQGHKEGSVAASMAAAEQGPSAMEGVSSDPQFRARELEALKALEEQSKDGLTARDQASLREAEMQANRANRGRMGAIQQNMASRGMGGSGMDMVAQMQSAQAAQELQAMRALETAGMAADRRSQGARDMGQMAGQMQRSDFEQQAAKARAADQIAAFNTQNKNQATQWNAANVQGVANANTASANQFANASMNAGMQGAEMGYNAATEEANRLALEEQERRKKKAAKKAAMGSTLGAVAGGVAGGLFGGPAGAAGGAQAGGQLGGQAAYAFSHGGVVPGEAKHPGDDPRNDTVAALMSPGEVVIPRSEVNKGSSHSDAIKDLLDAAERLRAPKKGR